MRGAIVGTGGGAWRRGASVAFAAAALAALCAQGVALATSAPLPLKAKEYSTNRYTHGVLVRLVTSTRSPRRIQAGPTPLGSQFTVAASSRAARARQRSP